MLRATPGPFREKETGPFQTAVSEAVEMETKCALCSWLSDTVVRLDSGPQAYPLGLTHHTPCKQLLFSEAGFFMLVHGNLFHVPRGVLMAT